MNDENNKNTEHDEKKENHLILFSLFFWGDFWSV